MFLRKSKRICIVSLEKDASHQEMKTDKWEVASRWCEISVSRFIILRSGTSTTLWRAKKFRIRVLGRQALIWTIWVSFELTISSLPGPVSCKISFLYSPFYFLVDLNMIRLASTLCCRNVQCLVLFKFAEGSALFLASIRVDCAAFGCFNLCETSLRLPCDYYSQLYIMFW